MQTISFLLFRLLAFLVKNRLKREKKIKKTFFPFTTTPSPGYALIFARIRIRQKKIADPKPWLKQFQNVVLIFIFHIYDYALLPEVSSIDGIAAVAAVLLTSTQGSPWISICIYICRYHTFEKVVIQRRTKVNNDAWMRGKWRPKKEFIWLIIAKHVGAFPFHTTLTTLSRALGAQLWP